MRTINGYSRDIILMSQSGPRDLLNNISLLQINDEAFTMSVTETVYRGQIRPWGKTRKSLGVVHLPKKLAADLLRWKEQCPDPSPEAFIFPNKDGDFIDTSNYRKRVLHKLAADLGLPKLTFQVIRRTIATLAQKKGTVKDVQGLLRHSRASTTTDVYMQEIPNSVQATVESINQELRNRSKTRGRRKEYPVQGAMTASQIGSSQNGLTPNDTKRGRPMSLSD